MTNTFADRITDHMKHNTSVSKDNKEDLTITNLFTPPKKISISLDYLIETRPNAFEILGQFRVLAKDEGWSDEDIKKVIAKAMSGDYKQLCETIQEHCF